jgi:hypothetical protein
VNCLESEGHLYCFWIVVSTPQRKYSISITNTRHLMLRSEIIAVYSENCTKYIPATHKPTL